MEWKDLYLDRHVNGYLVFKTLSQQKVMEAIRYLYKGKLSIQETELMIYKDCLVIKIDEEYFLDYVDLYRQIMRISNCSLDPLQKIMKIRNSMMEAYRTRLDAAIVGTTQWSLPFLIKMNIRHQNLVLDIYFENGNAYYESDGEIIALEDKNLYQKTMKKYKMEEKYES